MNNLGTKERVIILDLNSMLRIAYHTRTSDLLSWRVVGTDGRVIEIKTFPIMNVLRKIKKYSAEGTYAVYAVGDSKLISRKAYMKRVVKATDGGENGEYKQQHVAATGEFFNLMTVLSNLLTAVGIPVIKADNYEADDLIFGLVTEIRKKHPNVMIDVFSKDTDMFPMVDEQTSIYYSNKKETYYEKGSPQILKHAQITPGSYQRFAEMSSRYKGCEVPYNKFLITKAIIGDSDNVPRLTPHWTVANYNRFIRDYCADLELPYEEYKSCVVNKDTGEVVTDFAGVDISTLKRVYYLPSGNLEKVILAIDTFEKDLNKVVEEENAQIIEKNERAREKNDKREEKGQDRKWNENNPLKSKILLDSKQFKERVLGMMLNGAFTSEMGMQKEELRKPYTFKLDELHYFDFDKLVSLAKHQLGINLK